MRKIIGIVVIPILIIAFFLLAGASLGQMKNARSYEGCSRYDKALVALQSERVMAATDAARDVVDEQIADVQLQKEEDTACVSSPESPAASATPTPTPTPMPTADADDTWEPHYFFFDKGKQGKRSFGPSVDPDKAMKEFRERLTVDPSLACGNGGLIVNGKDGGRDCVKSLLKSKSARDAYIDEVFSNIESMEVKWQGAGRVPGAYMVNVKGIPSIIQVDSVPYKTRYQILVVKTRDGKTYAFRLLCGYQWVGRATEKPYTPVQPCENGNDRDENGSCGSKKPKHTATPTATATATPTETETPTATATPTPTCPEGKYCTPKATTTSPSGVESPTGNPVGSPTAKPTKKQSPLEPTTHTQSSAPSDGHEGGTTAPAAGGTPTATANEN